MFRFNLDVYSRACSYTKMGYAGNCEPQYIIPTVIATQEGKGQQKAATQKKGAEDLDFFIGTACTTTRRAHS